MFVGRQQIGIIAHGTIILLRPILEQGRTSFEENFGEPEPGGIFACEPRRRQPTLKAAESNVLSGNEQPPTGRSGSKVRQSG